MKKLVFIVGGTISGLGKGVVTASLGNILVNQGYGINITKFDPYLNYTAGNLAPKEHGEVFVTRDGGEVDLDVGHYQRFTGLNLGRENCYTSGRIISDLIDKDKGGELQGKTLQYIPTVTDRITELFNNTLRGNTDISLVEIGGSVGDLESYPYFHSIANLILDKKVDVSVILLTYIFENNGEQKTKPSQNSIRDLRAFGIEPDVVICRSRKRVLEKTLTKLSSTTRIPRDKIFPLEDVKNLYCVPQRLKGAVGVLDLIVDETHMDKIFPLYVEEKDATPITLDIVGKYGEDTDAYLSVVESLRHASLAYGRGVDIKIVNNISSLREDIQGVVIPGGFGGRGLEEKLKVIKHCREKDIPILGICLGMQLMLIDLLQGLLSIKGCSEEYEDNQPNDSIVIERVNLDKSMVLGEYKCSDGKYHIFRHRYCCKPEFLDLLINTGMVAGTHYNDTYAYPTGLELLKNKFYRGVQYHPEFDSNVNCPNQDFMDFISACI